jgi:hypothetical protein
VRLGARADNGVDRLDQDIAATHLGLGYVDQNDLSASGENALHRW